MPGILPRWILLTPVSGDTELASPDIEMVTILYMTVVAAASIPS